MVCASRQCLLLGMYTKAMYIIEGNIGAGKSTFLNLISQSIPEIISIPEPVHTWQSNQQGQSLLANFYRDPNRWAYSMETFALIARVHEHKNNKHYIHQRTTIIERSVYSGYYCFARNSYINGYMTDLEWELYTTIFTMLVSGELSLPQGFIYLKIDPEQALERTKKRNRSAESTLTLDYLRQIHERHEEFLVHTRDSMPELQHVPVLVLDVNYEFEHDKELQEQLLTQVREFIRLSPQIARAHPVIQESL